LDGYTWDFDWSDVEGATRYILHITHNQIGLTGNDFNNITSSSFHYEQQGYVDSTILEGWNWRVRAIVDGQLTDWSDIRTFDIEPPDTDPPATTPSSPSPTTPTVTSDVPILISPAEGAVLDNGRVDFLEEIVWDFDWSDVINATRYHLYVIRTPQGMPFINDDAIASSSFHYEQPGFVESGPWTWRVRAFVNGQWNEWSDTRNFDVEPWNTDTPTITPTPPPTTPSPTLSAPTLISPEDNEILDNGRTDFMDYRIWNFDWSDVADATRYHLYVHWGNRSEPPYIDNDNISTSSYHEEVKGFWWAGALDGWKWRVRAYINGQWGPWSRGGTFRVEPADTDSARPRPEASSTVALIQDTAPWSMGPGLYDMEHMRTFLEDQGYHVIELGSESLDPFDISNYRDASYWQGFDVVIMTYMIEDDLDVNQLLNSGTPVIVMRRSYPDDFGLGDYGSYEYTTTSRVVNNNHYITNGLAIDYLIATSDMATNNIGNAGYPSTILVDSGTNTEGVLVVHNINKYAFFGWIQASYMYWNSFSLAGSTLDGFYLLERTIEWMRD
jgi:hypothetical protein